MRGRGPKRGAVVPGAYKRSIVIDVGGHGARGGLEVHQLTIPRREPLSLPRRMWCRQ